MKTILLIWYWTITFAEQLTRAYLSLKRKHLFGRVAAGSCFPLFLISQAALLDGFQVGNKPFFDNRQYDFRPIIPGGSLKAGVPATVTLTCPPGLNGSDHAHYIYISGGIGNAEAALITGGTCTSGAPGTLSFTPANMHGGAWTISSASTGIKEALISCAASGGTGVLVTSPAASVYGVLDISDNCSLSGEGQYITQVQCWMAGRCIQWIGSVGTNAGVINMQNLGIIYRVTATSGEGLYVEDCATGDVHNLLISQSYDSMTLYSVAHLFLHEIYAGALHNGINISSNLNSSITAASYPQLSNVHLVLPTNIGIGISLSSELAGPQFTNMVIEQGAYCIALIDSSGYASNEGVFQGTCDAYGTAGIVFATEGGSGAARWNFHDSLINGTGPGMMFASAISHSFIDLTIANNTIGYSADFGISVGNAKGVKITGNTIFVNTASSGVGGAIEFVGGPVNGAVISGNIIGGGNYTDDVSSHGFYADANDHAGIFLSANTFYPTAEDVIVDKHTGRGLIEWSNNMGIDDAVPSVPSASVFPLAINPTMKITGSTPVIALSGPSWPGRKVTILNDSGASITILGHVVGANSSLSLTSDGTDWY
jgi:hypothetical protein